MCIQLYIAADGPLQLVVWNEAKPGFHVTQLSAEEEQVKVQFTKSNVVYVGSHSGCGCEFQSAEHDSKYHASEEITQGRQSLYEFSDYLRLETGRLGDIELFACWAGDEIAPAEHRRKLTPDDLKSLDFFFIEKELSLITVKK